MFGLLSNFLIFGGDIAIGKQLGSHGLNAQRAWRIKSRGLNSNSKSNQLHRSRVPAQPVSEISLILSESSWHNSLSWYWQGIFHMRRCSCRGTRRGGHPSTRQHILRLKVASLFTFPQIHSLMPNSSAICLKYTLRGENNLYYKKMRLTDHTNFDMFVSRVK